jgi:hypothetical protein
VKGNNGKALKMCSSKNLKRQKGIDTGLEQPCLGTNHGYIPTLLTK